MASETHDATTGSTERGDSVRYGAGPQKLPLPPQLERVALLIADNMTNKQIAKELGIGLRAVDAYVQRIGDRIPGAGPTRYRITQWVKGKLCPCCGQPI